MANTITVRHLLRADSEANWIAENPILLENEIVITQLEDGTLKMKVGDGVTPYASLIFLGDYFQTQINSILAQVLSNGFVMKDAITGEDYTVQIQNGQLVSFANSEVTEGS